MAAPNTPSARPRLVASHASAGRITVRLQATAATDATRRLPNRTVSQPEIGIAIAEPAPRPASAAPSDAGDSASASWTCGIRDAQHANATPQMKKSVAIATRARRSVVPVVTPPPHRTVPARDSIPATSVGGTSMLTRTLAALAVTAALCPAPIQAQAAPSASVSIADKVKGLEKLD